MPQKIIAQTTGKIADMKAENIKHLLKHGVYILRGCRIAPTIYMDAWVDLNDMNIYHSINGEIMSLVFPSLDAFAKHIEEISEPQKDEQ